MEIIRYPDDTGDDYCTYEDHHTVIIQSVNLKKRPRVIQNPPLDRWSFQTGPGLEAFAQQPLAFRKFQYLEYDLEFSLLFPLGYYGVLQCSDVAQKKGLQSDVRMCYNSNGGGNIRILIENTLDESVLIRKGVSIAWIELKRKKSSNG